MSPTLVHRVERWAQTVPDRAALFDRRPDDTWVSLTWRAYWERIRALAEGLARRGVAAGDAVVVIGANRSDQVCIQFAANLLRALPVPVYPTSTRAQVAYIVGHCGAKTVFVDDAHQVAKCRAAVEAGEMSVHRLVAFGPDAAATGADATIEELVDDGRSVLESPAEARLERLERSEVGLCIYTSGTTGRPKGVVLSHDGLCRMADTLLAEYAPIRNLDHRIISYLPLSHIAEQMFSNMVALSYGAEVYFCAELARIRETLLEVRPTVFVGVPRVWEKFEAVLRERMAAQPFVRSQLVEWARAVELRAFKRGIESKRPVSSVARSLAHRLVLGKLHQRLGFDRVVLAASGAAPISASTLEFFASLGIVIYEGYGMTETTGVATLQPYGAPKFGTVGRAMLGVEAKIASDGEVLLRGPTMCRGYLHDESETKALFDEDDWMHTGDVGHIDANGFLTLTGRKKDLLITAGGKNVAPAEIEGLATGIVGVSHAVVVGDRRPFLTALVAIDPEQTAALAAAAGVEDGPVDRLAAAPEVRDFLQAQIDMRVNATLARYQTIKRFRVLPAPLTVETGELTPSLKVKRSHVIDKYAEAIEAMYNPETASTDGGAPRRTV